MSEKGSREAAVAAVQLALTANREEEKKLRHIFCAEGIRTAAIDYGGGYESSVAKILERALVAAKREGIIGETHLEEGAVVGATHEAVSQIINKAAGLNLGGKIGIARIDSHISVCVFFAVGLLNLNDVVIGLGHRAV